MLSDRKEKFERTIIALQVFIHYTAGPLIGYVGNPYVSDLKTEILR